MQAELDEKAEMLASLDKQHRHAAGTSEELSHLRQRLEQQLAQSDSHIKHLEQELQREVQRGDVTKQNLVAAQQDYEQLRVQPPKCFRIYACHSTLQRMTPEFECRKRLQHCQRILR